jgi:hypothetical protein
MKYSFSLQREAFLMPEYVEFKAKKMGPLTCPILSGKYWITKFALSPN